MLSPSMSKLLEEGIEAVRALPPERQDAVGTLLLHFAAQDDLARYRLAPAQLEDLMESVAEADRNGFASEGYMAALWRKCGL